MGRSNNRRNSGGGGGGGNRGREGRGAGTDKDNNKRTAVKAGGGHIARPSKSPVKRVVQGLKTDTSRKSNDAAVSEGTKNRGGSKRGGRGRVGKGIRRGANSQERKKKPLTAEELDRNMDEYWLKSENKDAALKKLDEAMDEYWEKKGKTTDEAHVNAAESNE